MSIQNCYYVPRISNGVPVLVGLMVRDGLPLPPTGALAGLLQQVQVPQVSLIILTASER